MPIQGRKHVRKNSDKDEDNLIKETPPTKESVNLKIREDWGDGTNYGEIMFCQVTAGTAVEQQHVLSQSGGHTNPTCVLLDNQSTMEILLKRRLLKNIRKSDRSLELFSTGVRTTTDLQGDLLGHGTVWFHPWGITNTLCISKVTEKYRVYYDSTWKNKLLVHLPRGKLRSFTQCKRGLF